MAHALPDPLAASTYRIQLRKEFGFGEVAGVADYLADLGVTHVYLSPILTARPGSTHGYDVVDPLRISEELGGDGAFATMQSRLRDVGLKVLVDIVPNHVSATEDNQWWADVTANGADSEFAHVFDIDWDAPGDGLDYRRFFDIDDLAAIRQEDDRVFLLTHAKIAELVSAGAIDGIRVDHIDGLRDPGEYLHRLAGLAPGAWIVVEKILEGGERMPADWPVAGTTGYDFMRHTLGVLVDPAGEEPLTDLYVELTGDARSWREVALAGKYRAMDGGLATDVERVARAYGDDETWREFVRAAAAHMPVYRTYFPPTAEAVARFQQFSGPVMAKGVEDTAFYEYMRLVALNEVGGDPECFGTSIDAWHATMADRSPGGLNATATHDHKRGEDVRARLAVVSEMPDWWADAARAWLARHPGPDPHTAYLLLQTLVGAWPIDEGRAMQYMEKAVREAGTRTSWAEPDDDYERSVREAITTALADAAAIEEIVSVLGEPGRINSLSQALLRLTAPGVPDTYQGTELWDYSLVDPDNRRAVDFDLRRRLLASLGTDEPKLLVVARALEARRRYPDAFSGEYTPLNASDRVIAFMRGRDVVTVVPRFASRGIPATKVDLPTGHWRNVLTGEEVGDGDDLLRGFPVALLVK